MWSLPNIVAVNNAAHRDAEKLERASRTLKLNGKRVRCDYCEKPAVTTHLCYDIFSDDPKGLVGRCQEHDDDYGSLPEGYFYCDACNRLMVENYTWELYYVINEGEQLCLPCALQRFVDDEDNWIDLTSDEAIQRATTWESVWKTKHLIGVQMPHPQAVFINNVEFDSTMWNSIRRTATASRGGQDELRQTLLDLREKGHTQAALILDAAYQFAVSIGVYVRSAGVN